LTDHEILEVGNTFLVMRDGKKVSGPHSRQADALWWIDSQKAKRQRLAGDSDAQNT
jgi:hypothetical protein